MNPFVILAIVQSNYLTHVCTFHHFQNPQIRDWVLERIEHCTLHRKS